MSAAVKRQPAFTIIEVVLVLAVAGLIFLVVFAAVPRLQASRRDNARKDAARAMLSYAIEYESNTGSPLTASQFSTAIRTISTDANGGPWWPYVGEDDSVLTSPSGVRYGYRNDSAAPVHNNTGGTNGTQNDVHYKNPGFCNAAGTMVVTSENSVNATANQYGLVIGLERGVYCVDNS